MIGRAFGSVANMRSKSTAKGRCHDGKIYDKLVT